MSNVALHKQSLSHSSYDSQDYMVLGTKYISWANNLSLPSPWHGDSCHTSQSQRGRRGSVSPSLLLTPNSRLLHALIHPSLFLSKPPKSVHLLTCVRLHIVRRSKQPLRPQMKWQPAPPTGDQCPPRGLW